jgi:hypothetical protein
LDHSSLRWSKHYSRCKYGTLQARRLSNLSRRLSTEERMLFFSSIALRTLRASTIWSTGTMKSRLKVSLMPLLSLWATRMTELRREKSATKMGRGFKGVKMGSSNLLKLLQRLETMFRSCLSQLPSYST